ncbi:MAG: hypothetical protein Q9181_008177 [Wetmoreana brouardii]
MNLSRIKISMGEGIRGPAADEHPMQKNTCRRPINRGNGPGNVLPQFQALGKGLEVSKLMLRNATTLPKKNYNSSYSPKLKGYSPTTTGDMTHGPVSYRSNQKQGASRAYPDSNFGRDILGF